MKERNGETKSEALQLFNFSMGGTCTFHHGMYDSHSPFHYYPAFEIFFHDDDSNCSEFHKFCNIILTIIIVTSLESNIALILSLKLY